MKTRYFLLGTALLLISGCVSQKKLGYLNNLQPSGEPQYFPMSVPDYRIQYRDVLFISLKAMDPEGMIKDYLSGTTSSAGINASQGEGGGYLIGYNVNKFGNIILPMIDSLHVEGKTLDEIRSLLQIEYNKYYKNATVDCKLLSFKFTVIGEVKGPGTFVNYSSYLTVLEAVGRAGGIGDYGRRDRIVVVRPVGNETKTYRVNLQDKNLLTSEAYFLQPNDVIIIEPQSSKILNLDFPIISAVLSLITTALLLISYVGR
jgi:polysaccharide biosynthesis/export protein